jgi:magnesium transporter
MHKEISPIKDIIYKILRSENTLIRVETHKYYNDLLDHADQVIEQIDFLLSINKSQQDLHFATLSLRMNKIMETLTIITAIFIPLTFIVGVYGMNFENMPELEYKYGYYITWGVMILVVFIMISWFKRRKWM